jgi:hypothetical protein
LLRAILLNALQLSKLIKLPAGNEIASQFVLIYIQAPNCRRINMVNLGGKSMIEVGAVC